MFDNGWIAALSALFLWWFSTGAILIAVRVAEKKERHTKMTLGLFPLLLIGFAGIAATTGEGRVTSSLFPLSDVFLSDTAAVYISFLSALAIWGWIELAFLTGLITGPNTNICPKHIPEWERFIRAWGTVAYHEMLLTAALLAVAYLTFGADNTVGFWTFAVLYFARISAKLNLFLGVREINTEFLPRRLAHLPSHFRHGRINWLFPVSVTVLTFATACWLERIYSSITGAEVAGFALLSALTALALFEHWMMVLPLPDEKLWRWMLPEKTTIKTKRLNEEAHGL
ncbi:putative photosynthetic complex assembly protein PuhE [Litoreibacter roseus]|uniref:Photosynthetic complex assembly protein 2 n=1 Tax=Litoreibacter roseus TaxID=2601869 RepID=A0A6N6JE66_9RHOB|nr:putative photosynthetic complex assembly protein PuhE [Litoreibacter roseus]GFE64643.1 hypothetical protein KIN_17170 [Litoreibacter roseus]